MKVKENKYVWLVYERPNGQEPVGSPNFWGQSNYKTTYETHREKYLRGKAEKIVSQDNYGSFYKNHRIEEL